MMVVAVLMMSCQVSTLLNRGRLGAQITTKRTQITKNQARLTNRDARSAKRSKRFILTSKRDGIDELVPCRNETESSLASRAAAPGRLRRVARRSFGRSLRLPSAANPRRTQ